MSTIKRITLGTVTEAEKAEIEKMYKRKLGLESLAKTLTSSEEKAFDVNSEMSSKLVDELGTVTIAMQSWWREIAKKYGWSYAKEDTWGIDFSTNEVVLEHRRD